MTEKEAIDRICALYSRMATAARDGEMHVEFTNEELRALGDFSIDEYRRRISENRLNYHKSRSLAVSLKPRRSLQLD
jgi:hypothetical protein